MSLNTQEILTKLPSRRTKRTIILAKQNTKEDMNLVNVVKELLNLIILLLFGLIVIPVVFYWLIEDKIKGVKFVQ